MHISIERTCRHLQVRQALEGRQASACQAICSGQAKHSKVSQLA